MRSGTFGPKFDHMAEYIVLYGRRDPYDGRSNYRTVRAGGFKLVDTVNIRYDSRLYTYRKEYGRSRIRYG